MRYADALDIEEETANVASMLMSLRVPQQRATVRETTEPTILT